MSKFPLPRVIEQGLYELLNKKAGFARLIMNRQEMAIGIMLPNNNSPEKVEEVLNKHGIDTNREFVVAIHELLQSRLVTIFGPSRWEQEVPENYLFGHSLTANPLIRALFQVFASAEFEYCKLDLPQQSHEERLTGHLLSKLYYSLRFSSHSLQGVAMEIYDRDVPIELAYHDLSANRREAITGSDFGIILHVRLPDTPEFVSCASFQAKVLDRKKAYLPVNQAKDQLRFASKRGAYCCFYDLGDNTPFPPAVLSTQVIMEESSQTKGTGKYRIERDKIKQTATPLSMFLLMLMKSVEEGGLGFHCKSLSEAKDFMMNGIGTGMDNRHNQETEYPGPSRVLTLSIGGMRNQDFHRLNDLFGVDATRSIQRVENGEDE